MLGRGRGGAEGLGPVNRFESLLRTRIVDVEVVVRAQRPGDSLLRHRRHRVQRSGALKRPYGFFMVEREDKYESLIEEPLRLRIRGGDCMMMASQPGHQRWLGGRSADLSVLTLCGRCAIPLCWCAARGAGSDQDR